APDGSLVRIRANGTTIEVQRAVDPTGPGATFDSWSTLEAGATDGPVALDSDGAGELVAVYLDDSGRDIKARTSGTNGASWSSATVVASEAGAVGSLAVAYHPNTGNLAVFYILAGTSTLKHIRRTSGTWEMLPTTWSRSASADVLTGVAVDHDGANFQLAITGTDPDGRPPVWGAIMGDGALPANTWSTLNPIVQADAGATS